MTDSQILSLLSAIKRNPTFENWYEALTYAFSGEMDDSIDRLGGIDSFIDATLANSPSPPATKVKLDAALEAYVGAWQPQIPAPAGSIEKILRLIAARTPPSGFIKVLSVLVNFKSFAASGDAEPEVVNSINQLALTALRYYFPVPPSDRGNFPAYETYTKLLWDSLQKGAWSGDACARLVELEELKLTDPRSAELLKCRPDKVIPALLAWLLYTRRPERDLLLTQIYVGIRHTPSSLEIFRDAVADNGCRLIEDAGSARIALRSKDEIKLWVEDLESVRVQREAEREWPKGSSHVQRELEAILKETS